LSTNLELPGYKGLKLNLALTISLNNQDKVENYLKPMKNKGFQPFPRILVVEKALSKFWPLT
jgi:hypothetical protein